MQGVFKSKVYEHNWLINKRPITSNGPKNKQGNR